MSKAPFKGCWEFCTVDCKLKEFNGCRTNIPQYDLPPPNESCMHVSELCFGRASYDSAITEWHKARNKAKAEGLDPAVVPDWRETVGDRYALRPIYLDPTGDWLTSHKFLPIKLWCPDTIYSMLLSTPVILQATQVAVEGGGGIMQMRQLEKQIWLIFRTEYKKVWHEAEAVERSIPNREPYLQPTIEAHWAKAIKFFEMAVPILAQWMLLHYCSFPEQWAVLIARHVTFGLGWQHYAQRVATNAASGNAMKEPSKVVRIPRGADPTAFYSVKTSPESQGVINGPDKSGVVRIKRVRESDSGTSGSGPAPNP